MPIRKKLTLWYAGLLVIMTLVIGSAATATMYLTLVRAIDDRLEQTARRVLESARPRPDADYGGAADVGINLPHFNTFEASDIHVQVWQIWDDGQMVSPYCADSWPELEGSCSPLDSSVLSVGEPCFTYALINGIPFRVYTLPIHLAPGNQFGNIQVATSMTTVRQAIDRLLIIMIAGGMVSLVCAIGLGLMVSRMALRPIQDITHAAASVADTEDLGTRLPWHGPQDEIGQLTSVFNHMMERLQHLFGVQQRFVADVSHELRTPLTAIRGNLDIIKRYGMDVESLEAIESETARMSRMVNDLLLLARADYGDIQIELTPIDLDTVLSEVYREAKVLAKDRDLQVKIEEFQPVRVKGNTDRLKQLLLNLVSNALKFTPDGGKITLRLLEKNYSAVIQVCDTGIGIPPEHLNRIFDRFYQVDDARVHKGGGAGLGLSIAKWIAEAHGGSLHAESVVGEGTTFTVLIPVLDADEKLKSHQRPTRRSLRLPFGRSEEPKPK